MPCTGEIVITGLGVVSPIGNGVEAFWSSLSQGRSGVGPIQGFDSSMLPVRIAAEVHDFDPKQYVRPRKSLKVMARDSQFGVTAADMAMAQAGLSHGGVDPDRLGVVFGADAIATELCESLPAYEKCMEQGQFHFERWGTVGMHEIFPLVFLKILPNMIASHIAIAHDARGPNNTLHECEVSSLMAVGEAMRLIERGWADVVIAGGASSRMQPIDWVRSCLTDPLTRFTGDPQDASRPFDLQRSGMVRGEGAAAIVLERRQHAHARGAKVLGKALGFASAIAPRMNGKPPCGCGLGRAMQRALREADLSARQIGHINAHGLGTIDADRAEAAAINEVFHDTPVTAPKSLFGNLYAAGGAVELIASLLAIQRGLVPATRNFQRPDPTCPIRVIHGEPLSGAQSRAMLANQTSIGQAAALVVAGPEG